MLPLKTTNNCTSCQESVRTLLLILRSLQGVRDQTLDHHNDHHDFTENHMWVRMGRVLLVRLLCSCAERVYMSLHV